MSEISKYCASCGNGLLATAVICPKCGSPSPTPGGENKRHAKSKTVAVWLSVLFSYWAWLYTFNVNAKKFVVGLIVGLSATVLLIVGQIIFYRLSSEWGSCWYNQTMYFGGEGVELCDSLYNYSAYSWMIVTGFLISLGIWIWSVVDNARKPREFYESFGK